MRFIAEQTSGLLRAFADGDDAGRRHDERCFVRFGRRRFAQCVFPYIKLELDFLLAQSPDQFIGWTLVLNEESNHYYTCRIQFLSRWSFTFACSVLYLRPPD